MIIRKATLEDLDGIYRVNEAVKIDYNNPQKEINPYGSIDSLIEIGNQK